MTGPDIDPAALRAADAMTVLPDNPAAAEDIEQRREKSGISYFVSAPAPPTVLLRWWPDSLWPAAGSAGAPAAEKF